tara:strand:- start:438 stop:752 length:315 start_codon:yes stop_codon:yes gene_type:complete
MHLLEEHRATLIALLVGALSLIGGRISVDVPNHEEECAPELASVLAGNEALARCRQDVTDAEARGLEACVEREQRICAERVIAGGRADDALDCLVCETRCRVTE